MIITGRAVCGEGRAVSIDDGVISAIEEIDEATGPLVVPGLVDLQVNGYAGHDLNVPGLTVDTVAAVTVALRSVGTTTFVPTLITAERMLTLSALRVIAEACDRNPEVAAAVGGIHLEGPYLSSEPGCSGAHPVSSMRDPDPDDLARWQQASGGRVKIITLAPERPGSREFIELAAASGVIVSIGHTNATPVQVHAAVVAGASMSTHLGNGAAALLPRHDNYIWAQLAEPSLTAGLIADGHHLPWFTFRSICAAKGMDRVLLVSDAAALAGADPGTYTSPIGGEVTVGADGRLSITGTSFLAGGGASLLQCVDWASRYGGIELAEALASATERPAAFARLQDRGRLVVGRRADLLEIDDSGPSLRLEQVHVGSDH